MKWQKQLQCSHRIHKEIKKLKLWFSKARRGYPKLIMMATTIVLMITYLLRRMKFFILSSSYLRDWFVSNYAEAFDDFLCHQIMFVEEKLLTSNTIILIKEGGILDRVVQFIYLCLRVTFFAPRLTCRIMLSILREFYEECRENVQILLEILNPPKICKNSSQQVSRFEKSLSKKRLYDQAANDITSLEDHVSGCKFNCCSDNSARLSFEVQ